MSRVTPLEMVPPEMRPAHPHTGASPEYVVRMFLEGTREPEVPEQGDGLRTAYHLLTPSYRSEFGSCEEFAKHLRSAFMSMLVNHEAAKRGPLDVNDDVTEVSQEVCIRADDGNDYRYHFTIHKQPMGRFEGCWLVDEVALTMDTDFDSFQHMPTVEYEGQEIKCEPGEPIRNVILRAEGASPHNGSTDTLNCGGNSLCGTCAVEVVNAAAGETVSEPESGESRRLGLPPFRGSEVPNLRLSCQTKVLHDVRVRKHGGRLGQKYEDGDDRPWIAQFLDGEPVRVREEEAR